MKTYCRLILSIAALATLFACGGDYLDRGRGPECSRELDAGFKELKMAKRQGFSDSVSWGKAASLLSAAKIQQQFDEYYNCLLKAKRARAYLRQLKK